MQILRWKKDFDNTPKIVCLGFFDGLHEGHLKVINATLASAHKNNLLSLFFTLSESVSDYFKKMNTKLMENKVKQELIAARGFDYYLEGIVNDEFINLTAHQFLTILKEKYGAQKVVVGQDFSFGNKRTGNVKTLQDFFGKDNVTIIRRDPTSPASSYIRNLITNSHDLINANKLLAFPYSVTGVVDHGKKLGRTINFPTANIYLARKCLLPYGVYVSETLINNHSYPSLTSYMVNSKNQEAVETYLIDQNMNLYGQEIRVLFLEYIRPNIKISSIAELSELVNSDLSYWKQHYSNYSN
ncbi:bifunctional riboflavin kinase/FMN adenylyltransferase [Spiroplasma eriocheiris]|uniref:Riboflavin biosynthesis protein n=2 Tax=Spiroplasma eriocheiris TaxID=315358 RepID=A0A0H3XLG9_9MOLU|nr:bifunctional riboflavin kinase/FAD synthetase [Spiroplasma eriocheiris CCTCC M 207170]AKM54354.1 bifunctional riboflavin kinase/FMN adenylyltransferase [Spiroplasma eriocheiris]